MLQHLILAPHNGLCNRLRAIAAARRLCTRLGARCSLVWGWGDFWRFFAPLPDVRVLRFEPCLVDDRRQLRGVPVEERTIDVTARSVRVRSAQVFWGSDEKRVHLRDVAPFLPTLSERLQAMVRQFAADRLNQAVGFHMRRTDHVKARAASPDALFLEHAQEVVASGRQIFLATDNSQTKQKMVAEFGGSIITHPHRARLPQRWPRRQFDPVALEDDLLDLFLLASTQYVVGCWGSSFSSIAMALNGSHKCRRLGVDPRLAQLPT